MISKNEMFLEVVNIHPAFQNVLDGYASEFHGESCGVPQYLVISDLARDCLRLLEQRQCEKLSSIFAVVERWIVDGDAYVQEAAIVGFIEDLQQWSLHDGVAPNRFYPLLGPESRYWWWRVKRFHNHGELLLDSRSKRQIWRLRQLLPFWSVKP